MTTRREAVAITLLAQVNGIYTNRLQGTLNLPMAEKVFREVFSEGAQRGLLEQAGQLIAAYESVDTEEVQT